MITWTVCWGTRPILKRGRVTSIRGLCTGGGELNKAAGYRPCLNWDSAKFQLSCNWRNLIMSRVEGPWDTIPASFRFQNHISVLRYGDRPRPQLQPKALLSLLEIEHETAVYGDFLYRNTSPFIFLRRPHFYKNSYPVIQACHNLRNFQHWWKSYLYLLIIRIVKEQTGFRE